MDDFEGMISLPDESDTPLAVAGRTLIQLAHVTVRLEDRALAREFRLSYRQMRILKHIAAGVVSGTELAQIFGVTAPAISETLDSLVRRGLVVRMPHESDRRVVKLGLTAQGEDIHQRSEESERTLAAELLDMLTAEQVDEIHHLANTILVPNQKRLIERRMSQR